MSPEFLVHLPFLRLPPGAAQVLSGSGRLESLGFEEWLALEDPAQVYSDRRYQQIAPVFCRAPLPEGGEPGELTAEQEQAAADLIERVQAAAILALPTLPLAPVASSAAYVAWRGLPPAPVRAEGWFGPPEREPVEHGGDAGLQFGRIVVWLHQSPPGGGPTECWVVERRFGPAQREWLLSDYAREADTLTAAQMQAFSAWYALLLRAGWGTRRAAAVRCVDVVTAMGRPGTPLHEIVVLLVAALENLVNPDADRPLGETFARRGAAWFAETPAERPRDHAHFRRLYGVRSDILHGGDPAEALRALAATLDCTGENELRAWLRLHAQLAIDALAGWYAGHPEDDGGATGFRTGLAAAAALPDSEWEERRRTLLEGRHLVRR